MVPTGGGGGAGGGGGLSRFRSAPATWLEALLESEEEEDVIIDPPKPPLTPPPHLQHTSIASTATTSTTAATSKSTFPHPNLLIPNPISVRQNSSPAEFFSQISNSDSFLPNYTTANFDDYLSSSRDVGSDNQRIKLATQLSGDQSGLLDVEMDKLMGDSVPCRVRAKRGCATHPRSIAERVRRTKISDRIRKLQELVPNMDKQTNTADMLEEAVEYVKFLQTQIQELREHRSKCTCSV